MTKRKNVAVFAVLAAVALVVISVAWVAVYNGNVVSNDTVKIGVIGIFSGEYASYGVPMKNAIELYVDEVNAEGGIDGRQIELIVEDNAGDSVKVASAINKLVHVDDVDYVLSAQGSGLASVVAPIAQENDRVMMITLGSAPELAMTGDYVFRSVPSDVYQAVKMNSFMDELGSEKVAVLYVNDAYGEGIKNKINENRNVVANELFESNAVDYRSQLTKIRARDVDTLVVVAHTEYPSIMKQITELGIDANIITSETFKDDSMLADIGSGAEGVYVTFMKDSIDYAGFAGKYSARYGADEPVGFGIYAYDGAAALVKAIDSSGDDVEKVKNELYGVNFQGASGNVGFDSDGDRTGTEYSIYVVRGGEFVEI